MQQDNTIFEPLYTSKSRYFFLTGGRASLKSSEMHEFIARLTYEQGHGILCTRYTMTSATKSIIPEFKIVIDRLGITNHFDITKDRITNKYTDSFIIFSGIKTSSGDQTANLKSIAGVTTWVIDEGEDFNDEKTFDTIDDSIRSSGKQNRVIWIQNPTTKEHFIYKRWIEPKPRTIEIEGYKVTVSGLEEVEHIHSSYHIALEYLSKSWINKANKYKAEAEAMSKADRHKSHYYYNYIGGWLEKAEGVIFNNWEPGQMDESLIYCYGLDFGFSPDPTALIKVAPDSKNKIVYMQEEFYKTELSTDDIAEMIKARIKEHDLIVADGSEKREINELRKKNLNVISAKKGPDSIKAGIKSLTGWKFVICGDSPNLIKELNNYVWNDKKSGIPIDKFNHLIDPLRYAFDTLVMRRGI